MPANSKFSNPIFFDTDRVAFYFDTTFDGLSIRYSNSHVLGDDGLSRKTIRMSEAYQLMLLILSLVSQLQEQHKSEKLNIER